MIKNYRHLLLSVVAAVPLALSGCAPECVDFSDCNVKAKAEGKDFTCVAGACVAGSPFPDAGSAGGGTGGAMGGGTGGAMGGGTGGGGGMDDAGMDDAGMDDAGMDDAGMDDAGMDDAGMTDAGMTDAGTTDAGTTDAGTTDAGMTDAGMTDAGVDSGVIDAGVDSGVIDAGVDSGVTDSGVPELEIAQARTNAQGGLTTTVDISAATVTYLKPLVGAEGAGFFVQASAMGPAIFVGVDPTTLTPAPQVGDRVAFTATGYALIGGLSQVAGLSNFQRLSSGGSVSGLTQDLTNNPTVAASVDSLESELISIRGVLDGGFTSAGGSYVGAFLATVVSPTDNVRLRAPQAVVDAAELERGCDVTITSPLWRFNAQAQPNAWVGGDVLVNACPAPTVVSATPVSATSVNVNFSRSIQASSVSANGSQFTFDNGVTASAATVTGKSVNVTTTAQDGGTLYTVTVAGTVTDTRAAALGMPNTAQFTAIRPNVCAHKVVISQVYGGGGNNGAPYNQDFAELHNRSATAVDISGWSINTASATGTTWTQVVIPASTSLAAGAFYLVALGSTGGTGVALPTPDLVGVGFTLGATSGKVVLADATVPTIGAIACPTVSGIVDRVGFGSTANCTEAGPAAAPSNTNAILRRELTGSELACFDSNANDSDFVAAAPNPRNTATTASPCATACPAL